MEELDLSGIKCPVNSARAMLKLETMDPGSDLLLIVEDGTPVRHLIAALEAEGESIVSKEKNADKWRLRVQKR